MMAAVGTAFGLKACVMVHKRRSEAAKHVFDDLIRPNPKRVAADLRGHMTVAEMPRESYELTRLRVRHVDDGFGRGSNDEPRSVVELDAVPIGHGDRGGQIEKYLAALIRDQTEAPAMPLIEIESDRASGTFQRPFTSAPMSDCPQCHSSHISTGSSVVPLAALTRVRR